MHYFATTPAWESEGSRHACSVVLAMMLTNYDSRGHYVVMPLAPVASAGEWGTYAIEALPERIAPGPAQTAVLIRISFRVMGAPEVSRLMIEVSQKDFQVLANYPESFDDTGSKPGECSGSLQPACERFSVEYQFDTSSSGPYYPIRAHVKGLINDKNYVPQPVDKVLELTYGEKGYPDKLEPF